MSTLTTNLKSECYNCKKVTRTFNCEGCLQKYCFDCLTKHLQELRKDLKTFENDQEKFRQKLFDQKKDLKKGNLIEQIDQWENDSIQKIKQTAEQSRQRIFNYKTKFYSFIENKLNNISKQIKQLYQENQFNEFDLNDLNQKLNQLKHHLDNPPLIQIQTDSTNFIDKISSILPFDRDAKWKEEGIVVAGGNGLGSELNQLNGPQCIYIDEYENVLIADCSNNRIIQWKPLSTLGQVIAGGNGKGSQLNQLDRPGDLILDYENNSIIISDLENRRIVRTNLNNTNQQILIKDIDCDGITMDKHGIIYVSDSKKHEVRKWKIGEKNSILVAGGNGQGDDLNQLNYPSCLFIDDELSLYVSDCYNHRIVKWTKDAKQGIVVAGGNGQGDQLNQLHCPQAIILDQYQQIYISDWGNHRIVKWNQDEKEGTIIIGQYEQGDLFNQLNCPIGLAFDKQFNIYVADSENHRIIKFNIE